MQEEDFVTYTFNRSLLEEVDDLIIIDFIESTLMELMESETIQPRARRALAQRLGFRCAFLTTVGLVEDRSMPFEVKKSWTIALESLPGLRSELELSKPVPEGFSAKLQRKLASTVPPRPVVTVEIGAAYAHLERLCQDGLIVTEVLNFHDSHSLMVSFSPLFCLQFDTNPARILFFISKRESHSLQSTSALCSSTICSVG